MIKLTKDEKTVLFLLLICLFVGTSTLYYKKLHKPPSDSLQIDITESVQKININHATARELMTLRGIGPALAERIISYRTTHGHFKEKEEIKEIKGVGDVSYNRIKNYITVK